jgi:hypothetical protein
MPFDPPFSVWFLHGEMALMLSKFMEQATHLIAPVADELPEASEHRDAVMEVRVKATELFAEVGRAQAGVNQRVDAGRNLESTIRSLPEGFMRVIAFNAAVARGEINLVDADELRTKLSLDPPKVEPGASYGQFLHGVGLAAANASTVNTPVGQFQAWPVGGRMLFTGIPSVDAVKSGQWRRLESAIRFGDRSALQNALEQNPNNADPG